MSEGGRPGGEAAVRAAFENAETLPPDPSIDAPSGVPEDSNDDIGAPAAGLGGGDKGAEPTEQDPRCRDGAAFPPNDVGNGKRLTLYFGDDIVFVPRVGWHIWDGCRFALDPDQLAMRRHAQLVQHKIIDEIPNLTLEPWEERLLDQAKPTARRLKELNQKADFTAEEEDEKERLVTLSGEIEDVKDRRKKLRASHRRHANTSGNTSKIDAMMHEAKVDLVRDVKALDADPLSVCTLSGLLQFYQEEEEDGSMKARVELLPHPRKDDADPSGQIITKLMPVNYDTSAYSETWDKFLTRTQPDPANRAFLQRWCGLSLTGLMWQQFLFLYGLGANGKSVFTSTIERIMADYSATAKIESLTGRGRKGGGDATPDLMPLLGARMVRASEPEEGAKLQEALIKELTGGETILARALHSDFIEVKPIFKLTISGNHKPEIHGQDDGIWRRVLLLPWDVQIPPEERDKKLPEKLWAERDGIFSWMVEGLLDFLEHGLQEPETVLIATQDYREESDPYGKFLRAHCIVTGSSDDWLEGPRLRDAFTLWQLEEIGSSFQPRTISNRLKAQANRYVDPRTGGKFTTGRRATTGYHGIQLTKEWADRLDAAPRDHNGNVKRSTGTAQ